MSLWPRLNHHSSHRLPPPLVPSLQRHEINEHRRQLPAPPSSDVSVSFHYLPAVMDSLSVDLGHAVGHFDSVKGGMRQIYRLLVAAVCRYDPLPAMVRRAIELSLLAAGAKLLQQQQQPPLPAVVSSAELHKSDVETITALDIPYTLRHFDFDLSVGATTNANSDRTAVATAGWGSFGSLSFSLYDARNGGRGGGLGVVQLHMCRQLARLLVTDRVASTVRRAVRAAARSRLLAVARTSSNGSRDVSLPIASSAACSASNSSSSATTTAAAAAAAVASSTSASPSASTSTFSGGGGDKDTAGGDVGGRIGTRSLTAQLMLSMPLDGSNSNRAASQPSQYRHQTAGGEGRLCPLHSEKSGAPTGVTSCAVCASQHFLERHLQRLAQETGGLARLETVLGDCLQVQDNWRRSIHWVATSVKDKRLPESIRPLMQCICTDAVCGNATGGGGGGGGGVGSRGVTVNPQIIISTDGHCSALQCVSRCGSGGGGTGSDGGGGCSSRWGGGGKAGNCCWDSQLSASRDTS